MVHQGETKALFLVRRLAQYVPVALLVAALAFAACSFPASTPTQVATPTPTVPPTPTATPSPQSRLQEALIRLQSARSYQFTVDIQPTLKASGLALAIPIQADGAFSAPDRRRVKVSGALLGRSFGVERIQIGSTVYSRTEGQTTWQQGDQLGQSLPPALSGLLAFVTPDTGAAGLLGTAQDVQLLGEEDLNGEKALHLTAQVPFTRLGGNFTPSDKNLQVDIWLGAGDNLPRKLTVTGENPLSGSVGSDLTGLPITLRDVSLALTATLVLSQYGAPVDIESPIATQTPATTPSASVGAAKPALRFASAQDDALQVGNAIARFIAEKGYGYPVESVPAAPGAIPQLGQGEVDVLFGSVDESSKDVYNRELSSGAIRDLGPLADGGPAPSAPTVLVSSGLTAKAPDVSAMLDAMDVNPDALAETRAWMRANGATDYVAAAVHYLSTYKDQWATWVPKPVADRVNGVLPLPVEGGAPC